MYEALVTLRSVNAEQQQHQMASPESFIVITHSGSMGEGNGEREIGEALPSAVWDSLNVQASRIPEVLMARGTRVASISAGQDQFLYANQSQALRNVLLDIFGWWEMPNKGRI